MKVALGLFHFNPHWGLEARGRQRHCTEAFAPFLRVLESRSKGTVSLGVSGRGLEFLGNHYPSLLARLRGLVDSGRVELISALYTPSIWIAFPRRDLLESIHRNKVTLDRLGLPWARVFFAQEAFFGEAVSTLSEHFDVALCKDDYLNYFYSLDFTNPRFTAGPIKVVVASNHLLNESLKCLRSHPERLTRNGLTALHYEYIQSVAALNDGRNFPAWSGECEGLTWRWYHCGDGNHFSTTYKPQDMQHCFRDTAWERWNEELLNEFERDGYRLVGIRDFVELLDYKKGAQDLPTLLEGSWNSKSSQGVGAWMGDQHSPSANHNLVLSGLCRARQRVLECEATIEAALPASVRSSAFGHLNAPGRNRSILNRFLRRASRVALSNCQPHVDAWNALLEGQVSDSLGWRPSSESVAQGLASMDRVIASASELLDRFWRPTQDVSSNVQPDGRRSTAGDNGEQVSLPTMSIVGGHGTISIERMCPSHAIYEVAFAPMNAEFGVSLPFELDYLRYCPSGLECTPVRVPFALLKPETLSLPLSNGLLEVSPSTFLIKELVTLHLRAEVSRSDHTVRYLIRGGQCSLRYVWRFHIIRETLARAVAFANELNRTVCPTCNGRPQGCGFRRSKANAPHSG